MHIKVLYWFVVYGNALLRTEGLSTSGCWPQPWLLASDSNVVAASILENCDNGSVLSELIPIETLYIKNLLITFEFVTNHLLTQFFK